MVEYSREQFVELYKDLPEDLKKAMSSERTIDTTERLSDQEDLSDEEHHAFVKAIGDVLLGLVKPSKFKEELEKAGISKKGAEKINSSVQRFIFYPVRDTLAQLYEEELKIKKGPEVEELKEETGEKEEKKEKQKKPKKVKKEGDKYREEIE